MLEDLIMAATNEALRKMEEESAALMSKLTGGLGALAADSRSKRPYTAEVKNIGILQQSYSTN